MDKIICVNPETINDLMREGVAKNKLIYIPAYLNPIEDKEDTKKIPKSVWEFIEGNEVLISANGAIRFYNNEDLYGLDMLIELIKRLKTKEKNIKLLFCVLSVETQSIEERRYYNKLKDRITELGLEDKIMLFEVKETEFYPILKKSDIFIRPTNTDGYGVSIAEAIYYNVPSLASDVCERPEGTILFESRNQEDLTEEIIQLIGNYSEEKEKVKKIEVKDYFDELYKVYKELSGRN